MNSIDKTVVSIIFSFFDASEMPMCLDLLQELYDDSSYLEEYIRKNTYRVENGTVFRTPDIFHSIDDNYAKITILKNNQGNKLEWFRFGVLHRDSDLPAVIFDKQGTSFWYKNGLLHRDNGNPAVIYKQDLHHRKQEWYVNGILHRDSDNPSSIEQDVTKTTEKWYRNGHVYKRKIVDTHLEEVIYYDYIGRIHNDNDIPAYILTTKDVSCNKWFIT